MTEKLTFNYHTTDKSSLEFHKAWKLNPGIALEEKSEAWNHLRTEAWDQKISWWVNAWFILQLTTEPCNYLKTKKSTFSNLFFLAKSKLSIPNLIQHCGVWYFSTFFFPDRNRFTLAMPTLCTVGITDK